MQAADVQAVSFAPQNQSTGQACVQSAVQTDQFVINVSATRIHQRFCEDDGDGAAAATPIGSQFMVRS